MKLQLNNYDKIIFDMDGVITSEVSYWQTAALSAYDLLLSYEHYGSCGIDREWCRRKYKDIYNTVMCGGKTVRAVKRLGVNTNWDLLYIVFCVSKYLNPELSSPDSDHFSSVCMFIENIDIKAPEVYSALAGLAASVSPEYDEEYFGRGDSKFWDILLDTFTLWYHGCDEFDGIKTSDELLFDPSEIAAVLEKLRGGGIRLGIGTGRPIAEAEFPLEMFGLAKYFDKKLCAAYDDVCAAEAELKPKLPLAKPDPYVFLKAALGEKYGNAALYRGDYTYEDLERVLIVGDAPSDLISAKRAGFDFLAVLSGVEGASAESYFRENDADFILENILKMSEYC